MVFTHTKAPYAFMGVQTRYKESKAVVIPVPYDSTTSYRGGSREGPHAIITASRQVEFYDWELETEIAGEVPLHTMDEVEPSTDSPYETMNRVREAVEEVLGDGKFPITLGGEHSLSLGPVLAAKKYYKDLSVLQLDAHLDMREKYESSAYNHACVMRRIRENVKQAVQAGIRSISKEEWDHIKKSGLESTIYKSNQFDEKKILDQLTDEVYITVDLDVFDPAEMPAVGTPEPGGLSWNEGLRLLKAVAQHKRIVGFDLVELAPLAGQVHSEFFAAKLAYKMLGYAMLMKNLKNFSELECSRSDASLLESCKMHNNASCRFANSNTMKK